MLTPSPAAKIRAALCACTLAAGLALPALAEFKTYPVNEFNAVEVKGGILVTYTQGPKASVIVEQAQGDFSDIEIDVVGDALEITRPSLENRSWWRGQSMSSREVNGQLIVKVNGKTKPAYTVRVTSPTVKRLKAAASAHIDATGLNAGALELDASSSAEISAAGVSGNTVIEASSSASVDASALKASGLDLTASSSGDAKAVSIGAAPVKLDVSTSADADVKLSGARTVDASASTSGSLRISGTCGAAVYDASTSGDINAGGLNCQSANATASTSGNVDAYASQSADGHASTSGSIDFAGGPATRTEKESTSGDVNFVP